MRQILQKLFASFRADGIGFVSNFEELPFRWRTINLNKNDH